MRLHQNEFYLEVICGPMFAGKTTELYKRYKHAQKLNLKLNLFRVNSDARYGEGIATHDKVQFNMEDVVLVNNREEENMKLFGNLEDLIGKIEAKDPKIVMIEEAQFYMPMQKFADYVEHLVHDKHRIVIATLLQTNFAGKEFNDAGSLMALADRITTLYSLCTYKDNENNLCGEKATRNQRMVESKELIVVGGEDLYQPRCRKHFVKIE